MTAADLFEAHLDRAVALVMRVAAPTLKCNDSLLRAWRVYAQSGEPCLPVLDDEDELIGVVREHDLRSWLAETATGGRATAWCDLLVVEDIMRPPPSTVAPATPLRIAMGILRSEEAGALLVCQGRHFLGVVDAASMIPRIRIPRPAPDVDRQRLD
jgi:CBS domain-containing protein